MSGCGSFAAQPDPEFFSDLSVDHSMELLYANQFTVDYLTGGYKYLTIGSDQEILVVPEGLPVPDGMDEDVVILQQPLDQIYLVATAAMDYFRKLSV